MFRVFHECRHDSSLAKSSLANWVYLPGLTFQELTRCVPYLQASFQTCACTR